MIINKDWKIESDSLNVILFSRRISKKSKKEYWKAEGYFCNVKNALKAFVDMEIRGTGLASLEAVSKKQDELHKMIDALKVGNGKQT